jgi:hypothetical protein
MDNYRFDAQNGIKDSAGGATGPKIPNPRIPELIQHNVLGTSLRRKIKLVFLRVSHVSVSSLCMV